MNVLSNLLCLLPQLCHLSGQFWEPVRLQPQLGYIDLGIKGFLSYYWEILSGECPCYYSIFSHQPYHHLPHWHYPPSLNLPLPTRSNTSSPRHLSHLSPDFTNNSLHPSSKLIHLETRFVGPNTPTPHGWGVGQQSLNLNFVVRDLQIWPY